MRCGAVRCRRRTSAPHQRAPLFARRDGAASVARAASAAALDGRCSAIPCALEAREPHLFALHRPQHPAARLVLRRAATRGARQGRMAKQPAACCGCGGAQAGQLPG